jgi:NAD(P)-dependent dehydrogenase (short-subunit alcohol dehydrogenase family)
MLSNGAPDVFAADSRDSTFDRQRPVVWLLGGSSKLGQAIAGRLASAYKVVSWSRRAVQPDSEYYNHVPINLENIAQVHSTLEELLCRDAPSAIVFCQRYRPAPGCEEMDMLAGVNTEIISSQTVLEAVTKMGGARCSVVVISSVNGALINKQLPFWYHWLKSSQMLLVKYYSVKNGNAKINVNALALGSFLKDEISVYPEPLKKHLEALSRTCPMQENLKVGEIASVVEFLVSDHAAMINGQVITLDGGTTNILQETLI